MFHKNNISRGGEKDPFEEIVCDIGKESHYGHTDKKNPELGLSQKGEVLTIDLRLEGNWNSIDVADNHYHMVQDEAEETGEGYEPVPVDGIKE